MNEDDFMKRTHKGTIARWYKEIDNSKLDGSREDDF